jgi:ketosteroid isomerase-like protein
VTSAGPASSNAAIIERFYEAFARRDGQAMAACYAPDVRFSDPAFGELRGQQAGAMWTMLTGRADDLEVELVEHGAEGERGHARWIARYTFSQTGRHVVNDVRASFEFDGDGRISRHRDDFDFHRWSRQALGLPGLLLGWTPILRRSVQAKARASLDEYMASASA